MVRELLSRALGRRVRAAGAAETPRPTVRAITYCAACAGFSLYIAIRAIAFAGLGNVESGRWMPRQGVGLGHGALVTLAPVSQVFVLGHVLTSLHRKRPSSSIQR